MDLLPINSNLTFPHMCPGRRPRLIGPYIQGRTGCHHVDDTPLQTSLQSPPEGGYRCWITMGREWILVELHRLGCSGKLDWSNSGGRIKRSPSFWDVKRKGTCKWSRRRDYKTPGCEEDMQLCFTTHHSYTRTSFYLQEATWPHDVEIRKGGSPKTE